jgi:DNA-binding NtrC family response regulator
VSKTVLIVDDEPHIRLLLEQTLDDLDAHGIEIITATRTPTFRPFTRSASCRTGGPTSR